MERRDSTGSLGSMQSIEPHTRTHDAEAGVEHGWGSVVPS